MENGLFKTKFKETEIGMIPEEWGVKELRSEIELSYGKSLPKRNRIKGKYLVYGSNGVVDTHNKYIVKAPGIIIGRKGSVGEIVFSKHDFYPIDTTYYIILKKKGNISFWYYFLQTCYLNKMNSHAAVPGLNREDVYILKKAIPPIQEQKAIAKILSDLDSKIELLQKQNKTLENIGQVIFKHWFVDFEFPNENGKPYKSSGGKMIDSELGEIPEGWSVGNIDDGISSKLIKTGINNFKNEKTYLTTACVNGKDIIDTSTKITIIKKPSRANMQPIFNSIWFAKMKDSKKVLLINAYDKWILDNIILSTGFSGIKPLNDMLYYLWIIISSNKFEIEKNSLCLGTTMQAINNENIRKIKYLIPKNNLINNFNKVVDANFQKISINKLEIKTLQKTRDLLLPKLMSGKIRVKY
ncbi:MAG: hypothetical protein HF967_09335 [Methanosarcinales archaeon]|nr:hypothetical protein [Methanosarcinales archaeon]